MQPPKHNLSTAVPDALVSDKHQPSDPAPVVHPNAPDLQPSGKRRLPAATGELQLQDRRHASHEPHLAEVVPAENTSYEMAEDLPTVDSAESMEDGRVKRGEGRTANDRKPGRRTPSPAHRAASLQAPSDPARAATADAKQARLLSGRAAKRQKSAPCEGQDVGGTGTLPAKHVSNHASTPLDGPPAVQQDDESSQQLQAQDGIESQEGGRGTKPQRPLPTMCSAGTQADLKSPGHPGVQQAHAMSSTLMQKRN